MTLLLTIAAMAAFAANSLLARAALADGAIDAASFTALRLGSGAIALLALLIFQRGRGVLRTLPGSWPSAGCLFAYAIAFTFAYLRLGAATGALILFTAVQGTMILWGIVRRDHPTAPELVGLAIAFGAFVELMLPGLNMPDLLGSALMLISGISWGAYSLRGRGAANPLGETAGNFVRAALFCLPLGLMPLLGGHGTPRGVLLATISGVVTSGLGYAVWYRALPNLSTTQAAAVQLTVPIIAALGAVVFLAETLTVRLALATFFILGGVALAIRSRKLVEARSS